MGRFKTLVFAIPAILTGGIIIFWLINARPIKLPPASINIVSDSLPETNSESIVATTDFYPEDLTASLQASLSSLLARVKQLEENSFTNSTSPITSVINSIVFQPQVIFLGSASTQKREWTDAGIEVTLNTADYPANVKAVFEAGLSIIGGEAWARLVNKTTGAVMSITEVSHNKNDTLWKRSPSFKLHSGSYTYKIQLKSTSEEITKLSGARIIISQ